MRRASRAGAGLALIPHPRHQERVKPGIQRWSVGGVRREHGVMVVVSAVDVGMGVGTVDVDVRIAARTLGTQAVGPAFGEGGWGWEAGLGEAVISPQSSIWVVEGNGAGGEV